jgi:hypothetical protein
MSFTGLLKRYYMTVIMVSIFLLIYILNFINTAYSIANPTEDAPFPPWISACPDYWTNVSSDNKALCYKSGDNGLATFTPSTTDNIDVVKYAYNFDATKGDIKSVDFSDTTLKTKCLWSKGAQVYWEGISDKACSSFDV